MLCNFSSRKSQFLKRAEVPDHLPELQKVGGKWLDLFRGNEEVDVQEVFHGKSSWSDLTSAEVIGRPPTAIG